MPKILDDMKHLETTDPVFQKHIEEITQNFDSFPDEPLPGEMEGSVGRVFKVSWRDPNFLGYTYKKTTQKGIHVDARDMSVSVDSLLEGPGSSAGSG